MTRASSRLKSTSSAGIQKELQGLAPRRLEQVALTHRVRARRSTVLWIWAASSVVVLGPALAGGLGQALGLLAVTLAFAAMTTVSLRATVEIDADNRLIIRYLVYSFSDELRNIQLAATPKFDFRRDDNLGFKKLYQGTRLPCFNVGWFVLRNGGVAFVCVSRKRRARALRTRDGCYILVDPRIASRIQAAVSTSGPTRRNSPGVQDDPLTDDYRRAERATALDRVRFLDRRQGRLRKRIRLIR